MKSELFVHQSGLIQVLGCGDIHLEETRQAFLDMALRVRIGLVYSDPPWSPGNEAWWRSHARIGPSPGYLAFLDAWCSIVAATNAREVFVEQSISPRHHELLLDAVTRTAGWKLPLLEQWTVCYGPVQKNGERRRNLLFHFGTEALTTDPSGMHGPQMTRRVFEGLKRQSIWVVDPCMGFGMTSRLCHEKGRPFLGLEINPHRLEQAKQWLRTHGYKAFS